jgi:hypothetical protein
MKSEKVGDGGGDVQYIAIESLEKEAIRNRS